jgi:hypothetical protein
MSLYLGRPDRSPGWLVDQRRPIAQVLDEPVVTACSSADGQTHVCYSYEGCMPGYPVRWCTGNFAHIAAACDQCSPTQDDRERTWFPGEIWKFFTQF